MCHEAEGDKPEDQNLARARTELGIGPAPHDALHATDDALHSDVLDGETWHVEESRPGWWAGKKERSSSCLIRFER